MPVRIFSVSSLIGKSIDLLSFSSTSKEHDFLFSLYHHYQELSRRDGYLTFHRQTRNLRRTPLITISIGNAILVAMIKLLEDYQSRISPVQPWHCLAILTTVEVLIILIVLLRYLGND